jgi:hypothetical protein
MAIVRIQIEDGDHLESVVDMVCKMATAIRRTISFTFNGRDVVVNYNADPKAIIDDYIKRATVYKDND